QELHRLRLPLRLSRAVPLEPADLGHGQALLAGLVVLTLLLEDVVELLPRLAVVGEARDDRVELVARLVGEAVLAEDAAFREVLADELGVVAAQRRRELDRGPSGSTASGRRGYRAGVEGQRGNLVGPRELEVFFHADGGVPGRNRRKPPSPALLFGA